MRERWLRRSLLMTPGNRPERIEKAFGLGADTLVFDIEDGVPPGEKDRARAAIARAVAQPRPDGIERCVRVNAVGTDGFEADMEALPLRHIDSLMLPKVESVAAIQEAEAYLDAAERKLSRSRPIELILLIETPRGVMSALSLAEAGRRATALFFGSGDFSAATGGDMSAQSLHVPRSMVAMAAAAAGLQAIDAAFFAAVKDAEATREDAQTARALGFSGKVVFHPTQVPVANAVFSPTNEEIERARKIIAGYRDAKARGHGTAVVDGIFVAVDLLPAAERTLARARRAGLLNDTEGFD